jgi:hypothetical protein
MVNKDELKALHVRMYGALLRLEKAAKSNDIIEVNKWHDHFFDLFQLASKFLLKGQETKDDPLLNLFDDARNAFMMSLLDISKEIEELRKVGRGNIIQSYEENRKKSLESGRKLLMEIKAMLRG